MLLVFSMIPFLIVYCIFVFTPLVSTTATEYKVFKTKHLKCTANSTHNSLELKYDSFVMDVDGLSRACGTRLLTNDAKFIAMQQNTHAIIKLLFGDYHLISHSLEDDEMLRNELLSIQSKPSSGVMNATTEKFIRYDNNRGCLVVTRVVQNDQQKTRSLKYYPVKVQLPSVGALYNKMVAHGINLGFIVRMSPHIISSYEANFKIHNPDSPNLTKGLNDLVKKFIWKHVQLKGKQVERPSSSIMKSLANKFFKKTLDARLNTIKQGEGEEMCIHILSKPCTAYEDSVLSGLIYLKSRIKYMERFNLPVCPGVKKESCGEKIFYCIYTYNPGEYNKVKVVDSKRRDQKVTTSFMEANIPLMRVPEGTSLITYIIIPKKYLFKHLERKERLDFNKTKDSGKSQDSKGIPSSFSEISDEQLQTFMSYFNAYLSIVTNKNLL